MQRYPAVTFPIRHQVEYVNKNKKVEELKRGIGHKSAD